MNKRAARKKYEKLLFETRMPDRSLGADVNKFSTALVECIIQFLPNSLYRYRSCCRQNIDAFLSDKIYFNTPNNFNDPYDCLVYIDKKRTDDFINELERYNVIDDLKKMRSSSHIILESFGLNSQGPNKEYYDNVKNLSDDEFNNLLEHVAKIDKKGFIEFTVRLVQENSLILERFYREKIDIACFSERIDSILMWSHYADHHRGFALEYSGRDLFYLQPCRNCKEICENEGRLDVYPVIYGDRRIDTTEQLLELVAYDIHSAQLNKKLTLLNPDQLFPIKINTKKAHFWKYEKEWRLFRRAKKLTEGIKSVICHPTALYLGSKISPLNKKILTDHAQEKGISIFEMCERSDWRDYRLNSRKLRI